MHTLQKQQKNKIATPQQHTLYWIKPCFLTGRKINSTKTEQRTEDKNKKNKHQQTNKKQNKKHTTHRKQHQAQAQHTLLTKTPIKTKKQYNNTTTHK